MRPHILLLTTGGTIASLPTAEGLAPGLDGEALAGLLPQGIMDCYDITIRDILHLDSSNIQPEEWQTIARHVFENRMEYSGIVITHGTDTMAYTASVLSFMLRGISIPVVLTGAQLPMAHPLSDGMENLRTALAMAASGVPGVFLAFDRKVILGCRAVKTRTTDFDAFESVNWPLAANVDGKGLQIHREAIPAPAGACALRDKLCDKVFLIKLTPGLDPEIFDMLLQMHYRGIVIEAFGAGGLHFVRRDLIAKLQAAARAGMTVVVCSQCLYEPSDFSVYEVGQRALAQGVIQGRDMTTEAAVTSSCGCWARPAIRRSSGTTWSAPWPGRWRNQTARGKGPPPRNFRRRRALFQDCEEEAELLWARYHSPSGTSRPEWGRGSGRSR